MTAGRILWRALRVVQEREAMYGPPAEHWKRTAALVTVVLGENADRSLRVDVVEGSP